MRCVMKKLGNLSYDTFPNRIVHTVTYKFTCFISTQERKKNLHKFANLMTDFQEKIIKFINWSTYKKLKKFEEAWNHLDPIQQAMRGSAITKEYTYMQSHKVSKKTKRDQFPHSSNVMACDMPAFGQQ